MTTDPDLTVKESARQAAELDAMLRMLSLSSGVFSLSISVCNSPALRDYLIEKIRIARPDVQVICIPRDTTDVFAYVKQQVSTPDCSAVFITCLEELLPSTEARHPVLRSINASRELWETHFHCPIVIWLPEYAAGLMSREAPDFWRYRSHRFEFVSEQAHAFDGLQDDTSGRIDIASNLSVDEKQFRIAELEQRIEEAGPKPDKHTKQYVIQWLNELAFLKWSLGQPDDAEAIVQRLLALTEELGDKDAMATTCYNLGTLYRIRGDLEAAEQMFHKSLDLYEKLADKTAIAVNYDALGLLYRERGDLETAEQMFHKSLALADKAEMAAVYHNLGLLYGERGDIEAAEQLVRKSLAISEELDNRTGKAVNYCLLGMLYGERSNFEAAERMYRLSLAIEEELGNKTAMARNYHLIGQIYLKRGDIETGKKTLARSKELYLELGAEAELESIAELERLVEATTSSMKSN